MIPEEKKAKLQKIRELRAKAALLRAAEQKPEASSDPLVEFAKGFGKGLLKQAQGAGKVLSSIADNTKSVILGTIAPDINWEKYIQEDKKNNYLDALLNKQIKTEGTAQKVGDVASQIATFAVPAAKVDKFAKGIAKTAKEANAAKKLLYNLYRRALTSTADAGITALQTGGANDQTKTAAMFGALFPAGGFVSRYAGKNKTQDYVNKVYKAIRPGKKKFLREDKIDNAIKTIAAYNAKAGREMPKDLRSLADSISKIKTEVWRTVEKGLKDKQDAFVNTSELTAPIKEWLTQPGMAVIQPKVINNILEEVKRIETDYPKLTAMELEQIKEQINSILRSAYEGKGHVPHTQLELKAYEILNQQIGKALDKILDKAKLSDLKYTYGLMKEIEPDVIGRIPVSRRQVPSGLYDTFSSVAGADDVVYGLFNLAQGNPLGIAQTTAGVTQNIIGRLFTKGNDPDLLIKKGYEGLQKRYQRYLEGKRAISPAAENTPTAIRSMLLKTLLNLTNNNNQ